MLQLMGALYMGNKPLLKVDSKVAVVMVRDARAEDVAAAAAGRVCVLVSPLAFPFRLQSMSAARFSFLTRLSVCLPSWPTFCLQEQFLRLLHACGLPATDVDFINTDGPTMHKLLLKAQPRMTLFTG